MPDTDANTERNELLLMVAHDLRSVISVINGYSSILLNEQAEGLPARKTMIERLHNSSGRLIGFVDDIVRLALLGAGSDFLHATSRTPSELMRAAIEDLAGAAEAKSQHVNWISPEPDSPRNVDSHLVLMVLRNLLDNAIKYTPPQGLIEMKAFCGPGSLSFEVRDNGRGISPEQQGAIFGKLRRFPSSSSEQGRGIGLWSAKKMVEWHRGSISVESQPGQGSVFRFTVREVEDSANSSTSGDPQAVNQDSKK